ncbi:MAG TPA: DUF547 domain-containing protein [Thermoanaerobaculia bacterium]|jgi:hypothetical protein
MIALILAAAVDYSTWTRLLTTYTTPRGIDYAAMKAHDAAALQALRQQLGRVNVATLDRKQQLAYWINVYNVNVVAAVVEGYPVDSIRDLSTDPIVRLNVFKKERVPFGGALLSLDDVEHKKLREGFHDPRIHFAINCAARSCPPIRAEAYAGERIDTQLDQQVRSFIAQHVRYGRAGDTLVIHTTKIMDWFGEDFDRYGGGRAAFIARYAAPDKQRLIASAKKVEIEYDDYDWALNDTRR